MLFVLVILKLIHSSVGSSFLQYRIQRGVAVPKQGTPIALTLEVATSRAQFAETTTGANFTFKVDGQWSPAKRITRVAPGETVMLHVTLTGWPEQIKIQALGPDAWGFNKIALHWGDFVVTVLDTLIINQNYTSDSAYWVDGNEFAPRSNIYNVTKVEYEASHQTIQETPPNCTTRDDPRVDSWGYTTSPAGTPCVFGVDLRDEGSHCILDDGNYGEFGWCYTSEGKESWGSCAEQCPLFGPAKILGHKIDNLAH